MTRRLALLLALLLLGAASWVVLQTAERGELGPEPAGQPRDSTTAAPAPEALPEPASRRAALGAPAGPAPAPDESQSTVRAASDEGRAPVTGRVLDERGQPIVGAFVAESSAGRTASTGPDGEFHFPQPQGPARRDWRVVAWAEGREVAWAGHQLGQPLRVVLKPAEWMAVRVLDAETGEPIAGAETRWVVETLPAVEEGLAYQRTVVPIPGTEGRTGPDGTVRVARGSGHRVEARKEGYLPASVSGDWAGTLQLVRAGPLRFRLIDLEGRALPGATVGFAGGTARAVAGEQGWVEVPLEARRALAQMQIVAGERAWLFEETDAVPAPADGGELLFEHRPRQGVLRPPEGSPASGYEVATTAVIRYGGFLPRPGRHGSALTWQAVDADGSFVLDSGWQGRKTAIHVRRRADGYLVYSEELEGGGPYEVRLEPLTPVTLRFRLEPAARLDGARVFVREASFGSEEQELVRRMEERRAAFELRPGEYAVFVQFEGQSDRRMAGALAVGARPLDLTFDLGQLRDLKGRITAAGEPVFPCQLEFRLRPDPYHAGRSREFWATAATDETGAFLLRDAPGAGLVIGLNPRDPWLDLPHDDWRPVPDGAERFELELAVAELLILGADLNGYEADQVRFSRLGLAEDGGEPMRGEWTDRARLPDPADGPARIVTTPCDLGISIGADGVLIVPNRVRLPAGAVRQVRLTLVEAGRLSVRMAPGSGRYRGSFLVEPVEVAAAGEDLEAGAPELGGRWEAGQVEADRKLLPGSWRVRIPSGLFRRGEQETLEVRPEGAPWEIGVRVEAGRTTVVWIEVDEERKVRLSTEMFTP